MNDKCYILIFCLVLLSAAAMGQNNPIFGGGTDDGIAGQLHQQAINGQLFHGGDDDGNSSGSFEQAINNSIFQGSNDDGSSQAYFHQDVNNSIFGGGMEDGNAYMAYYQAVNNPVFAGGDDDGSDMSSFTQNVNSSIFAGGEDDGSASFWALGMPARLPAFLPIELLSFEAWPVEEKVQIQWVVANEINHDGYIVEKSQDLSVIQVVGDRKSQNAGEEPVAYEMEDLQPFAGKSYYRLRSIDLDGQVEYSSWVEVEFEPGALFTFKAYPNPTTARLNIELRAGGERDFDIRLFDLMGHRLALPFERVKVSGLFREEVDLSYLPEAVYLVQVLDPQNGSRKTYKIQKLSP